MVFGEIVSSRVRNFVIVRQGDRSCSCLPVTSYDGVGHRKAGIRLEEHGLIYSKRLPEIIDRMGSRALKVVLSRAGALREPSLVNYGKVYTVEINVKVKDVGELDRPSKAVLSNY